jgi:hypothetical protein
MNMPESINFREWHHLSISERSDCIHSAQLWLRGVSKTLLLPCDITDACRRKIIDEAERCEMDRDFIEDRLSFVRSGL